MHTHTKSIPYIYRAIPAPKEREIPRIGSSRRVPLRVVTSAIGSVVVVAALVLLAAHFLLRRKIMADELPMKGCAQERPILYIVALPGWDKKLSPGLRCAVSVFRGFR
jgi:hypothetical protein